MIADLIYGFVRGGGAACQRPCGDGAASETPEIAAALSEGAALAIVPLLLDAARPVRANLSLDAGLLDAIDEAGAWAHAFSFSRKHGAGEDRRSRGIARDSYRYARNARTARSPYQKKDAPSIVPAYGRKADVEFIENGSDPGARLRKRQPKKGERCS